MLEGNGTQEKTAAKFCSNCGMRLNEGAKFCTECGTAIGEAQGMEQESDNTQRKQEYLGKIFKCPNCGGQISETTVVCPDCGVHITGRKATSSVEEFNKQFMEIECRKRGILPGVFFTSSADKQKVELIRNFPIPNTVDDIVEFMVLATTSINVKLSKKGPFKSSGPLSMIEISNAWVMKMEQLYRKAELLFPNDPTFDGIQRMYQEKMKELKMKVI